MKVRWDDLEAVLEVWRAGTQERAAAALAVDQATVSRRIARLEQAAGVKLFTRRSGRLVPTTAGDVLLSRLEGVDKSINAARVALAAASAISETTVRVTALPFVAHRVLLPGLSLLVKRYPGLRIDLVSSERPPALLAGEADIAIRTNRPTEASLVARRIAMVPMRVYAPVIDPDTPSWIGLVGEAEATPEAQWLNENAPRNRLLLRLDSTQAVAAAIARGVGRGVLPVFIGRAEPGLVAVSDVVLVREVWLAVHPDLHQTPAVVATRRWIEDAFASMHLKD